MTLPKGIQQIVAEWHEKGQSRNVYEFDTSKNIENITPLTSTMRMLSLETTTQLSTTENECNEDNSLKFTSCIDDFKESYLGCRLPWRKGISKACTGKEKFSQFRNLSMSFHTPEIEMEIVKRECFIPNCKVRRWGFLDKMLTANPNNPNTTTTILYFLSGKTKVHFDVQNVNKQLIFLLLDG